MTAGGNRDESHCLKISHVVLTNHTLDYRNSYIIMGDSK